MFCPVAILRTVSSPRNAGPENSVEDFNFLKECFIRVTFVLGLRRGLCSVLHDTAVLEKEPVETAFWKAGRLVFSIQNWLYAFLSSSWLK